MPTSRHIGAHRVAVVTRKDERKTIRQASCLVFCLAALAMITGLCLLAGWWGTPGAAAADPNAPVTVYLHMTPTPDAAPVMPLQMPAAPTPRTAGGR